MLLTNLLKWRKKSNMHVNIGDLTHANLKRWQHMVINPARLNEIDHVAKVLIQAKPRLQAISTLTHVPWAEIGIISYREAGLVYQHGLPVDMRWDRNIAQGDPWVHRSIHVPKGRGPFKSWEDAAYDALVNCAPYAAKWKDWTIGGALTLLEQYNGLGYASMGKPSPYIWAYTDQYIKGKYTGDGRYDANAVDQEIGCAPLLARMYLMDNSISLGVPQNG